MKKLSQYYNANDIAYALVYWDKLKGKVALNFYDEKLEKFFPKYPRYSGNLIYEFWEELWDKTEDNLLSGETLGNSVERAINNAMIDLDEYSSDDLDDAYQSFTGEMEDYFEEIVTEFNLNEDEAIIDTIENFIAQDFRFVWWGVKN